MCAAEGGMVNDQSTAALGVDGCSPGRRGGDGYQSVMMRAKTWAGGAGHGGCGGRAMVSDSVWCAVGEGRVVLSASAVAMTVIEGRQARKRAE